ncbi:MAG TPA: metalloregulator ArsR/SmtB family transcription factor [Candidatus Limnocylindrales bacterium]|jgi:DNA-binding transcriptional ArsR family regulator
MDALQVIGEPRRREILRLVWDRERSAGEIADALPVTFGAVSQHLGVLREAGFVSVRRAGSHRFYRADRRALGPLAIALEAMWSSSLDRLAAAVEADPNPKRTPGR